jgi:hypothetical protein
MNEHYFDLKAEITVLKAALEKILQANNGWDWEQIASQHWDIARSALETVRAAEGNDRGQAS